MPLPRGLARANKAGLNRVTVKVAPWFPSLAVVVHHGRRSGRRYETPVMVFRAPDGFIIALTYGPQHTDWVRNVLAAGGCELRASGRTHQMRSPRVYHDDTRNGIRPVERQVLKLLGAADFLYLESVR
jgi:deazaflavin-dependent oxidoreductase (nitroreductase family)